MLSAFKIKPFDLEPTFASWPDAPRFIGNAKKDPLVSDWLAQIKAGCIERKIPRDYWHKVGQHYLGPKAKARLDNVKLVMKNMHGGKYKWNWKTFKTAMRNMGWDIDSSKTEAIKVQSKPSGLWWIVGRGGDSAPQEEASASSKPIRPPLKSKSASEVITTKSLPAPRRSATMSSIDTMSSIATSMFSRTPSNQSSAISTLPITTPSETPGDTLTTIAHAPLWLINACQSLDFLTNEHPKAMTALSAVLITVGSLPALPAISAGAGPAFLATSTAHALGSIAVGLGTWLKSQSDGQVQVTGPPTPPKS
ncbi:hypothetical protein POSPLADRAFT_1050364 [Postia placenta MAD-698-R-SB12]|uniref:Uncharacterized protein n=1 Tax=Postia placenta MAD-698-R-SB12 TaxID=670580 RepID=A0A1X6MKI3_9APHY|nr:hypothetical protein POSPLADRAFT_1050364 [Postia placenta MAD-698-R-SB12]OSX56961.1 hypothetical protein POSPLADRAFT_1050364 [Postia placenta MAD-698-R-SB12]